MEDLITFGVIIIVCVLVGIAQSIAEQKRLQKYWSRSCTGRQWRQRFPDVPKQDIRAFLQTFVDAFSFESNHRLKFYPTDKVLDVYQTVYPPYWPYDAMELEDFAYMLESEYGIDFAKVWQPEKTSLGDLFEMTRNLSQ